MGIVWRISLLVALACVITAVVGLAVSISLIRPASESAARTRLARLADLSATETDRAANAAAAQARVRHTLEAIRIQSATIEHNGQVITGSGLARAAVTNAVVTAVLSGNRVSQVVNAGGSSVLLEARPTGVGGIALVERRADATAAAGSAIERTAWSLLAAAVLAVGLGVITTRRLVRPLRHTAAAAHSLAAGRRDISVPPEGPPEIAEVATALNTLTSALTRSEARQREFLLSVSHDLRTPLTAITGYAETLGNGLIPTEDTPEVAAAIGTEAARLNRLVTDLLDLARLGAEDFRLEIGAVDLTELAGAAASTWAMRCQSAGLRFSADLPQHPVMAQTDSARVRQMLDGLLDNAVRVTPAGAPVLLAMRPGHRPDGVPAAVLEVRDGGPGLTPEDLPVAFDRSVLHRRYRGQREVGTGLGLAIVKGLADRLGIAVQAGHAPEGGAQFALIVPLPAADPAAPAGVPANS